MDDKILGEDLPLPPTRLFERLAHVPNYTWDHSVRTDTLPEGLQTDRARSSLHSTPHMTIGKNPAQ